MTPSLVLAFDVPPNDGFYTQTTQVLTAEQEQQIEQILTEYRAKTSNEIAILMVESLNGENISEAGVEVGRAWGVGTKDKDNGILIFGALADREIMIQTGYGLEGAVPDLVAKGIIDQDITPAFREADYYEGLLAAIDSLQKHIGGEYTAERYTETSGAGFPQFFFVFILIVVNFFGSLMARTKSWWLGGVLGAVMGIVLTVLYSWWVAIPVFVGLGLFFDYILSKYAGSHRRGGGGPFWFGGGGGGFGGRGGGGGFGGFGGGSFGGGGASGRW